MEAGGAGWAGQREEGTGQGRAAGAGPKGEEGGQLTLLLPALVSPDSPLLLQPVCWDVGGPG